MRLSHLLASTALGLGLIAPQFATAQTLPPERYTLDPRGVDLVRGQWTPISAQVSIGGATGLSHQRILLGDKWWDNAVSGMDAEYLVGAHVTVDGVTEYFDPDEAGNWVPRTNSGSTLTWFFDSPTLYYIYQKGGTIYRFDQLGDSTYRPAGFTQFLTYREEPNGLRTDYTYTYESFIKPEDPLNPVVAARLQSYQNNAGYQVHYDFVANTLDPADVEPWQKVQKVTAINLGVDYCDKAAYTCTLTRTWPSATFSETAGTGFTEQIVTDQSGLATRYRRSDLPGGGTRMETFVGANPAPLFTVDQGITRPEVTQVTDATGAWTYGYYDTLETRTTTVEGPMGEEVAVVSGLNGGLVLSATEVTSTSPAASRTWAWAYNGGGRVATATGPEGETADYLYDNRGNITQVTLSPKTGGTEADIVTSAAYPATCVNIVTCNLPTSTTDATGAVTNYTWDSTHGGPLTVTLPAPSGGAVRPQTRYAYAPQTAQFKNGAGVIVAAPTSITLPVETSACATGASCDATADEVLTTVDYGVASGVANNLLPASISRGSGAAPAMAVTALTYTPDGDVASVNGPLSGSDDTTTYRYDTSRRVVGVIGPDPDGGGAGLNRAQRMTYDARGLPILSETGTTAGHTDPNWAAFSPLQKSSAVYDDFGRPIETRQMSAADAVSGVQQTSYDAAGRVTCAAVRMNPSTFGALPSSACTAATTGGFGPDRITQVTYDVADRPLSVTTAYGTGDAQPQSQTYTVGGQLASFTDAKGNVSLFEYDGFNRQVKLRYPNATGGGTSTTDYEQTVYDAVGRPYSARNRAGELTYFGYDALNRLVTLNLPSGTPDVSTAYDNLGRVFSTSDGTITVNTTWDALSRPVSETSSGVGAMAYQYDAAGRVTRITWPDAFYADYEYDLYGGLKTVRENGATSGAGVLAAYGWNNLGQPASVTRAGGSGASTTYGYDAWGRLSSLAQNADGSANDVTYGFSHNPAGQLVTRMVSNGAYTRSGGGADYTVNGLNQATTSGGSPVTYDSNGNTTGISGDTYGYDAANRLTSASAGAGAAAFTFDPMNRLATSTVGGATTRRQYVGQQLAAEYNAGTGALTRRYIPGLGLDDVAAAYDGSGTSNRSWQLADERGSVIAQSGATGAVSAINTYDEYGVPAAGNVGRFQYTGQQWLPEAGAYHYRARTYLPQVGRFLQTDPIGYAAGANLYAYVGGDPVNRIDPMGLEFKDPKWTDRAECEREGWQVVRRSDGLWCTPKTVTGGPTVAIGDHGSWNDPNSAGGGGGVGGGVSGLSPSGMSRERCLSMVRGAMRLSEASSVIGRIGFGTAVVGGVASMSTGPLAVFLVPLSEGVGGTLLVTGLVLNATSVGFYGVATGDWGAAAVYGLQTTLTYAGPLGGFGRELAGWAGDEFVNKANLMDESACDARV
ncbi:RHS repeat-associated core domain-containing protein [Brevundimonas sp.]|uniref:RHS repeat domain-containing protein n=1 Tax=Brevundimonas sp. TaxID=1871086 RepID=UPI0025C00EF3|nr:RHS repeat-associated core domain-containing protein [Brevundimonas sp.]